MGLIGWRIVLAAGERRSGCVEGKEAEVIYYWFQGPLSVCHGDGDGDGVGDICGVYDAIPTVSEWRLVALALLLLIGANVCFGARRQAA